MHTQSNQLNLFDSLFKSLYDQGISILVCKHCFLFFTNCFCFLVVTGCFGFLFLWFQFNLNFINYCCNFLLQCELIMISDFSPRRFIRLIKLGTFKKHLATLLWIFFSPPELTTKSLKT